MVEVSIVGTDRCGGELCSGESVPVHHIN